MLVISAISLFAFAPATVASELSKDAVLAAFAAEDAVAYPSALSVSLVQVNRAKIKRAVAAQQAAQIATAFQGQEEEDEGLALIQTNAQFKEHPVEKNEAISVAADGTSTAEGARLPSHHPDGKMQVSLAADGAVEHLEL